MTASDDEFRAFFGRYARTFHEDLEQFCDLYEFPCETVRLDGSVQRFSMRGDAVRFFEIVKMAYESEGCRRWNIRGLVAEQPRSSSALVVVDWDMIDGAGSPIRGWRQSYTLVERLGVWKVCASTLHQGSERTYREAPAATRR
jgi:hypothetical protein